MLRYTTSQKGETSCLLILYQGYLRKRRGRRE